MLRRWDSLALAGCLVLSLGFAGCAGMTATGDDERRLLAVQDQNLDPEVRRAILEGRVVLGMSEGMVAASWGLPRNITDMGDTGIRTEVWGYGERLTPGWDASLTFEAGTLVDIQRTRLQGILDLWDDSEGRDFGHRDVSRMDRGLGD